MAANGLVVTSAVTAATAESAATVAAAAESTVTVAAAATREPGEPATAVRTEPASRRAARAFRDR